MDVEAVMDQVAEQADTIDGLTCYAYPVDKVASTPAWVLDYPDNYVFDATYGRGMDRMTLPGFLIVSKLSEQTTRNIAAAFLSGSGDASIKQVLQSGPYTAFHTLRVVGAEKEPATIGGEDYLAYRFDLDIAGPGE